MLKDKFNLENKITLKSVLKIVPAVALVVVVSGSILVNSGRKVEAETEKAPELNLTEEITKEAINLMADIDDITENGINRGGLDSELNDKKSKIKLKEVKLADKVLEKVNLDDKENADNINEDDVKAVEEANDSNEDTANTTVASTSSTQSTTTATTAARTITVASGEGWWHVGNRSGVDYRYLAVFNGKSWNDSLYTGQVLKVPTADELANIKLPVETTAPTTAATQAPTPTTQAPTTTQAPAPTTQATEAPSNNYYGPGNLNLSGYIGSVSQPGSGYYSAGWCTWYAYNARYAIGRPLPTYLGAADSWPYRAAAAGYVVNNTPAVGAVIYMGNMHVAFVEAVYGDGSILISEGGWNYTAFGYNKRVISAGSTGYYSYIH